MRCALHGLLLCCILTAGCFAGGVDVSNVSPTPTAERTPDWDPTPMAELASSGTACNEDLSVGFWSLGDNRSWSQDAVRVGYYLPGNTSVLLVTYVDGTVQGVAARDNTYDGGIHADGDELPLATSLSGTHVVRTVVYRDSDTDGQLSEGDAPCLVDGEVVQAGPERVNFSRFE